MIFGQLTRRTEGERVMVGEERTESLFFIETVSRLAKFSLRGASWVARKYFRK